MANGDLIILDGCTFFHSSANGDVDAQDGRGLFFRDVRHLSRWLVRIDGQELELLTSHSVAYYSARVVGKTETAADDRPRLAIRRDRFVTEGVHEDVVVENLTSEPQNVTLELEYATDFADVMEAEAGQNGSGRHWQDPHPRSVVLWNERRGYRRGTIVTFSRNGAVGKKRATFAIALRPRGT